MVRIGVADIFGDSPLASSPAVSDNAAWRNVLFFPKDLGPFPKNLWSLKLAAYLRTLFTHGHISWPVLHLGSSVAASHGMYHGPTPSFIGLNLAILNPPATNH